MSDHQADTLKIRKPEAPELPELGIMKPTDVNDIGMPITPKSPGDSVMKIGEWLGSKKSKTLLLGVATVIAEHLLGLPEGVAEKTMALFGAAIGGFAVQDWARARDSLSKVQWQALAPFFLKKLYGVVDDATYAKIAQTLGQVTEKELEDEVGNLGDIEHTKP